MHFYPIWLIILYIWPEQADIAKNGNTGKKVHSYPLPLFVHSFVCSAVVECRSLSWPGLPDGRGSGVWQYPIFHSCGVYHKAIESLPLIVGIEGSITAAPRKVLYEHSEYSPDYQSCRTLALCLTGDYWMRRQGTVIPYLGIGVGMAQRMSFYGDFVPDRIIGLAVNPRAGIQIWNRMRVTLEARLTHKLYNVAALRVGYCF